MTCALRRPSLLSIGVLRIVGRCGMSMGVSMPTRTCRGARVESPPPLRAAAAHARNVRGTLPGFRIGISISGRDAGGIGILMGEAARRPHPPCPRETRPGDQPSSRPVMAALSYRKTNALCSTNQPANHKKTHTGFAWHRAAGCPAEQSHPRPEKRGARWSVRRGPGWQGRTRGPMILNGQSAACLQAWHAGLLMLRRAVKGTLING